MMRTVQQYNANREYNEHGEKKKTVTTINSKVEDRKKKITLTTKQRMF